MTRAHMLLLLALAVFGCSGPQVPGNGQLVVIDVDDGFYANDLVVAAGDPDSQVAAAHADGGDAAAATSEMAAVRAGARYWNKLGANFKLADEVTVEEAAQGPPHFGVHRDSFSWPGEHTIGTDWSGLGYATIYPSSMREQGLLTYRRMREDVAHELGHALGMQHLGAAQLGTMTATAFWQGDAPSRDDQAQFCALYPGCSKVWN